MIAQNIVIHAARGIGLSQNMTVDAATVNSSGNVQSHCCVVS